MKKNILGLLALAAGLAMESAPPAGAVGSRHTLFSDPNRVERIKLEAQQRRDLRNQRIAEQFNKQRVNL